MATRLAFSVPGSAGTAGLDPSMDTVSWELVRDIAFGDFLFLCKAFWMVAGSEGRLASWWKTLRFRMMAYTKLQLPDPNSIRVGVRGGHQLGQQCHQNHQKCPTLKKGAKNGTIKQVSIKVKCENERRVSIALHLDLLTDFFLHVLCSVEHYKHPPTRQKLCSINRVGRTVGEYLKASFQNEI